MLIEAVGAAINENFSTFMEDLNPEIRFRSLIQISILNQCGLLQKHEEYENDIDYSSEISIHQEEIMRDKRKSEEQLIKMFNEHYEQRLKKIAIIVRSSTGWLEED